MTKEKTPNPIALNKKNKTDVDQRLGMMSGVEDTVDNFVAALGPRAEGWDPLGVQRYLKDHQIGKK